MQLCADTTTWPQIIAAVGAVLTSTFTLYLVHRTKQSELRSRSARETQLLALQIALVKLGVSAAEAERLTKVKR